ncbi:MAG: OsmC family protein [Anaerolineales bacterium]|nr:OsmC family protein [Anaerolineales bacterium]
MSTTAVYHTTVIWKGEHWGHLVMGNGPQMAFSAPPDAQGHPDVFTPEDAFVAAINTCVMMMFIWASERFKLDLVAYECRAEGLKVVQLDRTETFSEVTLWPQITVAANGKETAVIDARIQKALKSARKYSLIANSVQSKIHIEPTVIVL